MAGDGWGDGMMALAGIILIALCVFLFQRMTAGR
jgi:hypothetical protein